MRSFVGIVFVLFALTFHQQGDATRYLPMIVWDNLNPMLSCKCNWLNSVNLEIYDQIQFVCPSLLLSVRILDSYTRPLDHMNFNIYKRKFKGSSLDELKQQLESGEFCDPTSNQTKKLHTCWKGQEGKAYNVRVGKEQDMYKDDIVVFFNNQINGKASSLNSKNKRCTMAFVAKITWEVATMYDFAYNKSLNYKAAECNSLNNTYCTAPPLSSLPPPSTTQAPTQTTLHPTNNATNNATNTTETKSTKPTTNLRTTSSNGIPTSDFGTTVENPNSSARKGDNDDDSWDRFTYGFLAGCGTILLSMVVIAVAYFLLCSSEKKKRSRIVTCYKYKNGRDGCQSTVVNNLNSQNEAAELPKKNKNTGSGVNNRGFHSTLKRDSAILNNQ